MITTLVWLVVMAAIALLWLAIGFIKEGRRKPESLETEVIWLRRSVSLAVRSVLVLSVAIGLIAVRLIVHMEKSEQRLKIIEAKLVNEEEPKQ